MPKFLYLESQLAFSAGEQVKANLQADLMIKEFGLKCKLKPQAKMTAQMQPELAADLRTLFINLPHAGCGKSLLSPLYGLVYCCITMFAKSVGLSEIKLE